MPVTYCRICHASCGLIVDIENGVPVRVKPDELNPGSRGFSCPKGRRIIDFHTHPDRLTRSQKRTPDGTFAPIGSHDAISEIAARLCAIRDEHGPDSIAVFFGTQGYLTPGTFAVALAWWKALGSHKAFTTMTIDQVAKVVTLARMGQYLGGTQEFATADVWLLAGSNPPISLGVLGGFPTNDPIARLREAKQRGLKLIVVDPRHTETARHADVHLQLVPGTDAVLFAALLHVVFRDGLDDPAFTDQYANGVDELRAAVAPVTPERAARVCGVAAADIVTAAHVFGGRKRGVACSGTGTDMGPRSNLTEHLITGLNVVCGRYLRAGEPYTDNSVLTAPRSRRAQVLPPARMWDSGWRSRLGFGLIPSRVGGELPATILPDEILTPGPDRVRALVVVGANPAAAIPDQDRVVEAFRSLDLLVTADPWMSETARLAHYVLAPALPFERCDTTAVAEAAFSVPFAQYTPALIDRPGDVIDDWELFWGLATGMGLPLMLGSVKLDYEGTANRTGGDVPLTAVDAARKPTTDELLSMLTADGRVSLADVKAHPHGLLAELPVDTVLPADDDDRGHRLELFPDDVAAEMSAMTDEDLSTRAAATDTYPFRLIVRRTKETFNSSGRTIVGLQRWGTNPLFAHPDDLAELGLTARETVRMSSAHGAVEAVVEPDATLRRGVVAMTHLWGGLPGDRHGAAGIGSNAGRLVSCTDPAEAYSNMPRLTAVPVRIEAAPAAT